MTPSRSERKPERTGARWPSLTEVRALRARLAAATDEILAAEWTDAPPLEQVLRFKLLPAERGLRLFPRLALETQMLLLQAEEPESLAPLLLAAPEARAELHALSAVQRERLFDMARKRAEGARA